MDRYEHVEIAGGGAATRFLIALRHFAGALLAHFAARGELLAVEIAEEKQRLFESAIAVGLLVLTAVLALVFAGVLLIVWAWDTEYRMPVAVLLPVAFALIAIGSYAWLRHLTSRATALFKTSLGDLRRDAEELRD
jgi:uncharacterized membrane protein YqjE